MVNNLGNPQRSLVKSVLPNIYLIMFEQDDQNIVEPCDEAISIVQSDGI